MENRKIYGYIGLFAEDGKVIFETVGSPIKNLFNFIETHQKIIQNQDLILIANQAGIANVILSEKIKIKKIVCQYISKPALKLASEKGIEVIHNKVVDLIKSSHDISVVCPLEKFLSQTEPENYYQKLKNYLND